jgi:hypothetical protein
LKKTTVYGEAVDARERVESTLEGGLPMAWRKQQLACSFCGKRAADVAKLVAGPQVFICDACVAVAVRLMQGPPTGSPVDHPRSAASSFWQRLRAVATLIASKFPRTRYPIASSS